MRLRLAAVLAVTLAAGARAEPAPPPAPQPAAPPAGLFGEREPQEGDEAAAAGAVAPAEGPKDKAYDARIRDSFGAAEAYQGPLDGGWTLTAENQGAILDLRFEDHDGHLEGAWRDLRRKGALDASGVIDRATRLGDALTLEFSTRPGVHDFLSLKRARGGWTGELTEAGRTREVWLSKTSP